MKDGELTAQEKEFCRLLAIGKSKTAAYVDSGLLKKGGSRAGACVSAVRLLKNANIKAYYDKCKAEIASSEDKIVKTIADKEAKAAKEYDCVAFIRRVWSGEELEDGQPASMAVRLKAAETDAKIRGLMTNKTEVTGDIVIDVVFDNE